MSKKTIYYVTGNASKCKLFAQFVPQNSGIELKQFHYDLIEEQIENQQEIAVSKAKQAWAQLKSPLIVDEVGVYFHKYKNFPGAFTKFVYKGLGFSGINKLMEEGDTLSIELNVVYAFGPSDFKLFTTRVSGYYKKPIDATHDTNAPFDLVFVPEGFDKSYIELESYPEIYNQVYFRALAMKKIIEYINNNEMLTMAQKITVKENIY